MLTVSDVVTIRLDVTRNTITFAVVAFTLQIGIK